MEFIDVDLISSDQDTPKEVLEVYDYLKIYKSSYAREQWLKRRKENWDLIENKAWTEAEIAEFKEQKQQPFVVNKAVKGVQGSCAVATDRRPTVDFHPVGSGDLYVAELFKRGFNLVWDKNEGNETVYEYLEECKIGALSWLSASLDKSKNPFGRIEFEEENPEWVFFDPESRKRDFSDTHIIKARMRSRGYIKEHYPDLKNVDVYFLPTSTDDKQKSSGITGGDNYAEGTDEPDYIDPDTKSKQKVIWEIEAWMLRREKEDWYIRLGDDGQPEVGKLEKPESLPSGAEIWPREITKREQRIIVGKKLVSSEVNPMGEDQDGEPVVRFIGMKAQRTRTAFPMSPTDYARPIVKEKSKRRMQSIHAASHLINAPLYFYEGTYWVGNPGTPGSYARLPKNIPGPPGRVPSGALDVVQLMRLEEKADAEIDDIYDLHDVVRGKLPAGEQKPSGRAVLALQDMAGTMSRPTIRRLESSIVRLGKLIVAMMLKHWPRYLWERLLEDEERLNFAPEETPEGQKMAEAGKDSPETEDIQQKIAEKWAKALELIRPSDPTEPPGIELIDVDVRVAAGSSLPTNRIARGDMAIQYVSAGIYDAQAALEYIDDPNKDKILERLKSNAAMMVQQGAKK